MTGSCKFGMKQNLGLYIHIPFCRKKCGYCDFLSFPLENYPELARDYVPALRREIKDRLIPLLTRYRLASIYVGGGTPSILPESELALVFDVLPLDDRVEFTVEANPDTLSPGKMKFLKQSGVNRLSLGLQSSQDQFLELLGRLYTAREFEKCFARLREIGFDNLSLDLIFGIPGQTLKDWEKELDYVIKIGPEHVSAYPLTIEEGTRFHAAGYREPEDEVFARMFKKRKMLVEAGYRQYEIASFAREGFECLHNLNYWDCGDYLGVGLGASSLIEGKRYRNTANLEEYVRSAASGEVAYESVTLLSRRQQMEEYMFLGLRKVRGVNLAGFRDRFGVLAQEEFKNAIEYLQKNGLIDINRDHMAIKEKYLGIANEIFALFIE